ncbi:MAG: SpoIIE family protein phosphatase [Bacteroidetes bacterium]|nr:SpoIIE family protein phosphatase [Bacteroidota bacterium]
MSDASVAEVKEIKANKQAIGKTDNPLPFTTHSLDLKEGDQLFLFTDGYADQFGGPKGKKFKYKQLQDVLISISSLSMNDQQLELDKRFIEWLGEHEQVDDVTIIGIRV